MEVRTVAQTILIAVELVKMFRGIARVLQARRDKQKGVKAE